MLDDYLAANNYEDINDQNIRYFKAKALAHLRKEEIFNCIQNHTGQSCIVPIIESGIHLSKHGLIPNSLLINKGDHFSDETVSSGLFFKGPTGSIAAADFNLDGHLDLFVGNEYSRKIRIPSYLYMNNGDGTFTDGGIPLGMLSINKYVKDANWGDINNDSYPDIYLGTGELNTWATVPNKAYLNNGGRSFDEVTFAGQFGQIQQGHGVAFGDLDNDGDQDIYHQVGGSAEGDVFQNMLFQNPGFGNNWINLKIEVFVSNERSERDVFYHQVITGGSFGASTLRAEIGLAKFNEIDSIKIYWPNKERSISIIYNIDINQHYTGKEGDDHLTQLKIKSSPLHLNHSNHAHH